MSGPWGAFVTLCLNEVKPLPVTLTKNGFRVERRALLMRVGSDTGARGAASSPTGFAL